MPQNKITACSEGSTEEATEELSRSVSQYFLPEAGERVLKEVREGHSSSLANKERPSPSARGERRRRPPVSASPGTPESTETPRPPRRASFLSCLHHITAVSMWPPTPWAGCQQTSLEISFHHLEPWSRARVDDSK